MTQPICTVVHSLHIMVTLHSPEMDNVLATFYHTIYFKVRISSICNYAYLLNACKDVPWLPSFHWLGLVIGLGVGHGRRINTEEMAKFVAAVWGTEFIQFLAAHAILHQDEWKNRMNGTRMI